MHKEYKFQACEREQSAFKQCITRLIQLCGKLQNSLTCSQILITSKYTFLSQTEAIYEKYMHCNTRTASSSEYIAAWHNILINNNVVIIGDRLISSLCN